MAKMSPDAVLDAPLTYIAASDLITVCTTEPATYAQATDHVDVGGLCLASHALAAGDFTIADDPLLTGRKVTITAQAAVAILHSGNAQHIALTLAGDTTLRYVTTCDLQALVAGGTVDLPTWKITFADPT